MAAATIASKIALSSSFCVDIDPRDESLHVAPPGTLGGSPTGQYFLAMCLCCGQVAGWEGACLDRGTGQTGPRGARQSARLASTWICSLTSCLNPYLSP